jgi:hypothetical protein
MTDVVDIFELFLDKVLAQNTVDETNRYALQFIHSRGNILSKQSGVNHWQSMTTEEINAVLALSCLWELYRREV